MYFVLRGWVHNGHMALVISHISALQLMSAGRVPLAGAHSRPSEDEWILDMQPLQITTKHRKERPSPSAPRQEDIRYVLASRWGIAPPVHALVDNNSSIRNHKTLTCHVGESTMQGKFFFAIERNIFCCIPKLCFLQLAARLPLIDLIVLGFELCGFYAAQATGFPKMIRRRPLTTTNRIRKFLETQPGAVGIRNALRAINYVLDGSASPAETTLAILLTLPCRMGGYGLPKPLLNHRIPKTTPALTYEHANQKENDEANNVDRAMAICDLCWPDNDLVMEYDSSQEHSGSEQIEKDARRRNDLTPHLSVLTSTNKQIARLQDADHLAALTAKHLGRRVRIRTKNYRGKKSQLRANLNRIHKNRWLSL